MLRHRFQRLVAPLTIAVSLAVASLDASATMMRPTTVEALSQRADEVVIAVARTEQSHWEGTLIVTDLELEVQTTLRGSSRTGALLRLRLPGGVVGRTGQHVPGVPQPVRDRPYVFFLSHAPDVSGVFYLAHLTAGVLPVVRMPDGAIAVQPAREGIVVREGGTTASNTTAMRAAGIPMEQFVHAVSAP